MDALDPELWRIVWLSLRVSGTALLMSALIGIPLGAWLGLSRFPGRSFVSAIIHAGMGLPPVIVSASAPTATDSASSLSALREKKSDQPILSKRHRE